jgi:cytochrome c
MSARMLRFLMLSLLVMLVVPTGSSFAQTQSVRRGAEFARAHCARCHSVERSGPSPFSPAPPFRTLHQKYPVENLEETLAEGIFTGHPAMPEFALEPGQIGDFIAFLKSLE